MIYRLPRWILYGSVLLSLTAGIVNAIALLGFVSLSVSHVTGTATLTSTAIVQGDWRHYGAGVMTILAFLVGAMLSGMIVRGESLQLGRRYGVALILEAMLLYAACLAFTQRWFVGEMLASMACGLQNAMIATYSGSVIRTTHLTGLVTDIGVALGNWLTGRPVKQLQVVLQLAICIGFFWGGALGAWLFQHWHYWALLVPATIVLSTGLIYTLMLHQGRLESH